MESILIHFSYQGKQYEGFATPIMEGGAIQYYHVTAPGINEVIESIAGMGRLILGSNFMSREDGDA